MNLSDDVMKKKIIIRRKRLVSQINFEPLRFYVTNRSQSGFGLIEVLIAVVVMAVGFLAAAMMQIEGMRFTQSAYYQSQANFLANDMIERMRGNIQGVLDGDYDNKSTSANASNPNCTDCTPTQVAQRDIYDWSTTLFPIAGTAGFIPALPGGSESANGIIIPLTGDQYAIELTWTELVAGEMELQRHRIQFELASNAI